MMFADRSDAGRRLAAILEPYRTERPVILGLPRGGVIVASEVAHWMEAPLDVLAVRKLGAPGAPEFAIGAIAPGATLLNMELIERLRVSREYLAQVIATETDELYRRERAYRGDRLAVDVESRTVILVDDGLATGATAQAAIDSVRWHHPWRIVFAAPIGSPEGAAALANTADAVVCLARPHCLRSIGEWYYDFTPTSDTEVLECLRASSQDHFLRHS